MGNRGDVVDAKTYKLSSAFTKSHLFITCGWIIQDNKKIPIEIFINSKDLGLGKELTLMTRLISAIFRRNNDVSFIVEELSGIYDPDGARWRDNKLYPSLYSEIGEVIQQFFDDIKYKQKEN